MKNIQLDTTYISNKMIEMVKKAIVIIQSHADNPVIFEKTNLKNDGTIDFATQADIEAQAMYEKEIVSDSAFKGFGIVGEEGLNLPCSHPEADIFFTCDPLDGTKAYERKQAAGVGTMIALIMNGEVIISCIGDVNTNQIYSYVKGEKPVRTRFGKDEVMVYNGKDFKQVHILLKENPYELPPNIQKMFYGETKICKNIEVASGSIGTMTARLWSNEVGAMIMQNSHMTPWDIAPVASLSYSLGYIFMTYDEEKNTFEEYTVPFIKDIVFFGKKDTFFVIHKTKKAELLAWCAANL